MDGNHKTLDIVIPGLNEALNISSLFEKLETICLQINQELAITSTVIYVDDGSTDKTASVIKNITPANFKVKLIELSRNFGHQIALKAGIDNSTADFVATLDADMQHPPELLHKLVTLAMRGHDVVYTVRQDAESTPFLKKATSRLFYKLINMISDVNLEYGAADFRVISARVANLIRQNTENPLFIRGFIAWCGFSQAKVPYTAHDRLNGKSKYNLVKMVSFAINGITSFSVKPLRIATLIGFCMSALAGIYGLYAILLYVFSVHIISGWASVLLSVLFVGGIQLIILGIMGEYVGKGFIENKRRPTYIIKNLN